MVAAIPLVTKYNISKLHTFQAKRVPDPLLIQACAWVQYCHALRISECLTLEKKDFDFEYHIITLRRTKTGFDKKGPGKERIDQFTSIPPDLPKWVIDYINSSVGLIFKLTRQLVWSYYKKSATLAGLEIAERQKKRMIKGMWTHAIRKARSKLMKELGASRELRMTKLRHAFKDSQDAYDAEDINALIKWESENIHGYKD